MNVAFPFSFTRELGTPEADLRQARVWRPLPRGGGLRELLGAVGRAHPEWQPVLRSLCGPKASEWLLTFKSGKSNIKMRVYTLVKNREMRPPGPAVRGVAFGREHPRFVFGPKWGPSGNQGGYDLGGSTGQLHLRVQVSARECHPPSRAADPA